MSWEGWQGLAENTRQVESWAGLGCFGEGSGRFWEEEQEVMLKQERMWLGQRKETVCFIRNNSRVREEELPYLCLKSSFLSSLSDYTKQRNLSLVTYLYLMKSKKGSKRVPYRSINNVLNSLIYPSPFSL